MVIPILDGTTNPIRGWIKFILRHAARMFLLFGMSWLGLAIYSFRYVLDSLGVSSSESLDQEAGAVLAIAFAMLLIGSPLSYLCNLLVFRLRRTQLEWGILRIAISGVTQGFALTLVFGGLIFVLKHFKELVGVSLGSELDLVLAALLSLPVSALVGALVADWLVWVGTKYRHRM